MKIFLLFISFSLYFFFCDAQYKVVVIDSIGSMISLNEPSIELNPHNTNQIVAGTNLNSYFYSHDQGYTWTEGTLTSSFGVYGDPVIVCDTAGHFYFFHLANPSFGSWVDRIVCQKSVDGGMSWNDGSFTGKNEKKVQDKHWISIDRTNNNMYVTWTQFDKYGSKAPEDSSVIMFSKSTDAGETWSDALRINKTAGDCEDGDNTVEGAVPGVGPTGEIYVAWAGKKENGDLAIMFDKSLDQGETWLDDDIFVVDFPGGWTYDIPGISRCNGLPVLKCDTSHTETRGTIYINWTDQRNGTEDTDVWLIKSEDGGETWSEKKRVNDDEPGKQQFLTWIDIDQTTGFLYFIFYDRRHHSDNNTDVYMAVSKDGGETFENIMISESPFNPNALIFFGDYTNISVHEGVIAPIWTRADGFKRSIRTVVKINE